MEGFRVKLKSWQESTISAIVNAAGYRTACGKQDLKRSERSCLVFIFKIFLSWTTESKHSASAEFYKELNFQNKTVPFKFSIQSLAEKGFSKRGRVQLSEWHC